MSQHGEGSEAGEEYSYYSSSGTVDTLEDLLQRFTLDYQPDYALKLRHRRVASAAAAPWLTGDLGDL